MGYSTDSRQSLVVPPGALTEVRTDNAMTSMRRQLSSHYWIVSPASLAAITASRITPFTALRMNTC
jgi:hypothetical protein